eukprot:scaffold3414_cov183-Ochromonas_danica.AAC.6
MMVWQCKTAARAAKSKGQQYLHARFIRNFGILNSVNSPTRKCGKVQTNACMHADNELSEERNTKISARTKIETAKVSLSAAIVNHFSSLRRHHPCYLSPW